LPRLDPATETVDTVYSGRDLVTVDVGTPIEDAVRLMREHAVRRLPVVDQGRAIGVVSLGDLAIERDEGSALPISRQRNPTPDRPTPRPQPGEQARNRFGPSKAFTEGKGNLYRHLPKYRDVVMAMDRFSATARMSYEDARYEGRSRRYASIARLVTLIVGLGFVVAGIVAAVVVELFAVFAP